MTNIHSIQLNFDVFISYRHTEPDMSWVREILVPRLKEEGLRVFIDVEQFDVGKPVVAEMDRARQQSRYTLAVVSPAYLEGDFAKYENVIARYAEDKSRFLMALREPCELPPRLRSSLYFDMTEDTAFATTSSKLCSKLKPRKLFLVYAETDADETWVKGYLQSGLGIDAWIIDRKNNFKPGAFTDVETDKAITDSDYTVLILSPAFFADEWAREVLTRTLHLGLENPGKQAIFLKRTTCELPDSIAAREILDFSEFSIAKKNLKLLCKNLGLPEPKLKQLEIECPYPGMIPFKEDDARFFYGRDDEINTAKGILRHQNFLFVIGPSGSGKSSLVFAGIIPALKKKDPGRWLVKSFRPGKFPVEELKKILAISAIAVPHEKDIIAADCITRILTKSPPAQQLLLIIDQLEELFVLASAEQQSNFFTSIRALFSIPECKIIFTIRADFYADLMKCDLWSVVSGAQLNVNALSSDCLAKAMIEPAKVKGVFLEKSLVEHLLADAANEPGVLPLIQETMKLLWEQMEQRLLTLDKYMQLATDGRSGLTKALSDKAEGTLNSLNQYQNNEQHQLIAHRIFLRLIHFGVGRGDTRRQQSLKDLMIQEENSEVFEKTIQHLATNRLLTLSSDFENGNSKGKDLKKKVDISHEALISGWPTLQKWIAERRESEITRRRLEDKARDWIEGGASTKTSLLDEVELIKATEWLKSEAAEDLGYSRDLVNLCAVSRNKIHRFKLIKRVVLSALFILFTATLLFLMATIWQLGVSEYHRNNARASRLAATAELIRAKNPNKLPLSLLIAIESISPELRADSAGSLIFGKTSTLAGTRILRDNLALLAEPILSEITTGARIKAIAYSPDGKLFASASGNQLCLWETINDQKTFCLTHDATVTNLVFGPNNSRIYTSSKDKQLRSWNSKTGERLWTTTSDKTIKAIVLNNEGNLLAGITGEKVQLWHTVDGAKGSEFNHEGTIKAISFASNSNLLNSAGRHKVIVWNVNAKKKLKVLVFDTNVMHHTYSPGGYLLAVENRSTNTVSVWDLRNMIKILDTKHADSIYAIAFDQQGEYLATGGKEGISRVWKLADGSSKTFTGQKIDKVALGKIQIQKSGAVWDIAFSADGRYLATASTNFTVSIWNRKNGSEFLRMVHDKLVRQLVFNPRNESIASATKTGAWLWGLNKGDEMARLIHDTIVTKLSFSLDGRYLCTLDADSHTYVWDIKSGKNVSEKEQLCITKNSPSQSSAYKTRVETDAHKVRVMHKDQQIAEVHHIDLELAAISVDGKFLATTSDNWIHIWQWQPSRLLFWKNGQFTKLSDIRNVQLGINDIAFSPDNQYLATAGSDNTAIVGYWQHADLVDRACARLNKKQLSEPEWKDYIHDGDYRKTCPKAPADE